MGSGEGTDWGKLRAEEWYIGVKQARRGVEKCSRQREQLVQRPCGYREYCWRVEREEGYGEQGMR